MLRPWKWGGILLAVVVALAVSPGISWGQWQTQALSASQNSGAATGPSGNSHLVLKLSAKPGEVDLNWSSDYSHITAIDIQRSDYGQNNWTNLKTVGPDVTSYQDFGIGTDTPYDYRLIAYGDNSIPLGKSDIETTAKKSLIEALQGKSQLTLKDFLDISFWRSAIVELVLDTLGFIPKVLVALILFGIFWVIYRMVRRIVIGSMSRAHVDSSIRDMLSALIRWSILGFGLVIACNEVGIQIAALLTGVSIIGLAMGFAAQETLANFIAGVVIFWDKPFKVGDWIVIDSTFARVLRVSFRSTRMLNLNGETIVMPNTYMLDNRVSNHSTHPMIRVEIPIGIAYKESIDAARTALLGTVHGDERICPHPAPSVVVDQCADSSVNLILRVWIKDVSVERDVFYTYMEKAKKALDAAKIDIPFPHMQLFLEQTEAVAMLAGGKKG